jgi:tRNA (guanine37-N1)-methyltransferase
MLTVEVLTLFPRMVQGPLCESILFRAREKGLLDVTVTDIRGFAHDKHKVCDDTPYGGGAGMVMKPEPLTEAIEAAKARLPGAPVILMGPRGRTFEQAAARTLQAQRSFILICGHYEGIDERVQPLIDDEISLGDFILTGGELAALCVIDAVARLEPGVLGNSASTCRESFEEGLLEHPHYTRPPVFREERVPDVLLSGDHAKIARWRRAQSLRVTRERRPDLFSKLTLTKADVALLREADSEEECGGEDDHEKSDS